LQRAYLIWKRAVFRAGSCGTLISVGKQRLSIACLNESDKRQQERKMDVSLFVTCYNDTFFPDTGRAVVKLMQRLGHSVSFPLAQTCCGQMHFNTGYRREAYPIVRHFLSVFRDAEVVCIPSSSCVAMIRDSYLALAHECDDMQMAADIECLLPRIYELTELLVDRMGLDDVGASFPHRVTYHASCHGLRNLQLGDKPLRLLRKVKGMKLLELQDVERCCGFGGTFAVKNAEVSTAMLTEKVNSILDTKAEVCTACDNSCLMHIYGMLHRQFPAVWTAHIAEILASEEAQ
jgi:L-lactate dehydrogenase complex protein LldE